MLRDRTCGSESSSFKLAVCDNRPGKNDELQDTLPVDERIGEWLKLSEYVAGGKCGFVQLWGDTGGELSTTIGGAAGQLWGASRKHNAAMATISGQRRFPLRLVLQRMDEMGHGWAGWEASNTVGGRDKDR